MPGSPFFTSEKHKKSSGNHGEGGELPKTWRRSRFTVSSVWRRSVFTQSLATTSLYALNVLLNKINTHTTHLLLNPLLPFSQFHSFCFHLSLSSCLWVSEPALTEHQLAKYSYYQVARSFSNSTWLTNKSRWEIIPSVSKNRRRTGEKRAKNFCWEEKGRELGGNWSATELSVDTQTSITSLCRQRRQHR